MIIGKHNLLGRVEIRNENKPKFETNLKLGLYEVTLNKAQIYVYLDWIKRGKIEVSDPNKEFNRLNGLSCGNVYFPISEVRVETN